MSKKINKYTMSTAPTQIERINEMLALYGLDGMKSAFTPIAEENLKQNQTPLDYLERLVSVESVSKDEKRMKSWLLQAQFPPNMTLEGFDFSFQPGINQRQINDLATGRFIDETKNIIFQGQTGVGKTHLATSLGIKALEEGNSAKFIELSELIYQFSQKQNDIAKYRVFYSSLLRPDLLIIDEMRNQSVSVETKDFLYNLIRRRYEVKSTIFTSNQPLSEWGKVFGLDANPILGRILHHAITIHIDGKDYRAEGPKNN